MDETNTDNLIYSVTDLDGDTLSVSFRDAVGWVFTVSGEDGHRSVFLGHEELSRLAATLSREVNPVDRLDRIRRASIMAARHLDAGGTEAASEWIAVLRSLAGPLLIDEALRTLDKAINDEGATADPSATVVGDFREGRA